MHYTSQDLFVGATANAPNCPPSSHEQRIWSKFMLMVVLQGSQHFVIDDVRFRLDAGDAEAPSPLVFMLNVAQTSRLRFIEHRHVHDAHHRHDHAPGDPPGEPHTHPHRHGRLVHAHAHYPDLHHRHTH